MAGTKKKATKKAATKSTVQIKTKGFSAVAKQRSKSQVVAELADATQMSKKEVGAVLEAMGGLIKQDLGSKGPGLFAVPGLMKIKRVHKPKRPARKGTNPFTGEEMMFKAKPARNVVKILPLKALKEMV